MSTGILYYLLSIIITFVNVNSDCTWTAVDNNGDTQTLDLSCLQVDGPLKAQDDQSHDYEFSVCENGLSCNSQSEGLQSVMVSQAGTGGAIGQCFILGKWESSIQPQVSESLGGSWQFSYPNGEEGCGTLRTWEPSFVCDATQEYQVGQVLEQNCVYGVTIYTKYACLGTNAHCDLDDDSSGLSGGWIFIIILLSGLFLYFVIGYIVMALTVNKEGGFGDFANNIPNRSLWVNIPPLVIAGCSTTKDFIMGLINKEGSDDKDEALTGQNGGHSTEA